jgi:hypothetical protein
MTMPLDPATKFVRSLDGTYYMVREAAEILGVSHRVLRKMNDDPESEMKPSFAAYLGKIKIYLYTEDDITKIRDYLEIERKRIYPNEPGVGPERKGRPSQFTKSERKERQRLYSKAHYYGKRAEEETSRGNLAKASQYLAKQRQVKKELKNWRTERPLVSPTKSPSTETVAGSSSSTART